MSAQIIEGNQRIETFGNREGFFQNTVRSITADKNGYLWFCTPNGLIRYDGYSFENYYHEPQNPASIPNNRLSSLFNDSNGRLWIATRDGLCLYFPDEERFAPLAYGIKGEPMITEDTQNKIWVGEKSLLHVFESTDGAIEKVNKVGEIDLSKTLQNEDIVDLYFISDSELVVASSAKIYKIILKETSNYSFEISPLALDFQPEEITDFIKADNSWWIATTNGLFKVFLEKNKLTTVKSFFNNDEETAGNNILTTFIYIDKEEKLWLGTRKNGLFQYDSENDSFISYKQDLENSNTLSSNFITTLFEDEFKVLWIGTVQGGVNKLDKNQKPFRNYDHNPYDDQSISGNLITDIAEDRDGNIWFTFYNGTICQVRKSSNFSKTKYISFKRLENQFRTLENETVYSIYEDQKGFFWVGTLSGIYLYDQSNDRLHKVTIEKDGNIITLVQTRKIEQIDDSHMLIGGSQICLLKDPWEAILSDRPIQLKNDILDLGYVNDFTADDHNTYWFAIRMRGLRQVTIDNGEFKMKSQLSTTANENNLKLSHNNIFSIHISQDKKYMWLGSFGGGLMKVKLSSKGEPENIKNYNRKSGLPDDAIYGIIEDDQGIFWLSTDRGICQFNPLTETFDVYDVNDGLASENYRQSAYLKSRSGLIYMGGVNGLTVFNPDDIKKNRIPPKIILSHLRIDNQLITAKKLYKNERIIEKSISDTEKLVLDYQNRNISMDVVVQHSSAPKKNKLSYKLEGVNEDWINGEKGKITATYTNLNPGTYKFLYKGANGDGIWTQETNELILVILAPWYLRWWSLLIFGLLLLLIGYLLFRYSLSQEKLKQKLNFEKLDRQRIHEMDQAKLRFFTNISHDFKTPLSLIIGPFEKISEDNIREHNKKYFSIIQNNIARLQRMIEQLTSYRKAETGHLKLNFTEVTLGDFTYPLMEAFEENAKRNNIDFYHKINSPNRTITIDIDKTERIILNLYSNAVKYSRADSSISFCADIKIDGDSAKLYFEMADTGIGISSKKLDKIFDRFYRGVDDRGEWSGTGVGLALSKTLIDLMDGTIEVESRPNEKTVFRITIPINQKSENIDKFDSNKRKSIDEWLPVISEEFLVHENIHNLPTILVIDDEIEIRSFLKETFKDRYHVILAVDGEDGLKKLAAHQPQLVISDIMMPKQNGYEVCKKIKSNLETCHIPVILLTALSNEAKKLEGLELGADDYISKPFSIKHVEIRVKQLIESRQRIIDYFSKNSIFPKEGLQFSEGEREFLVKVNDSMERNMSQSSFGTEELSKDIGMSRSHFYRKLKQLTGQVPNEYLRNFRLQCAVKIMEENKDLNATQVMYRIGIESPSYFATSFKKIYGISPSEFIKNLKGTSENNQL